MTPPRPLLALALAAAALFAPLATAPSAAASPSPGHAARASATAQSAAPASHLDLAAPAIDVQVSPLGRGIVQVGSDLLLSVSITNRTTVALPGGTATVFLADSASADSDALAAWLAESPDGVLPGARALVQVPTPEVAAGATSTLQAIVVAADALALVEPVALGARELTVQISAGDTVVATERSAVTVAPAAGAPVAGLSVAMPLITPPGTTGLIPAELLTEYTSPGGQLTRQLDQSFGRPVALGIDPRIVASIRALGTAAPQTALDWLTRLESAPNATFPLAFADSDIALTSQAGAGIIRPEFIELDPTNFTALPGEGETPGPIPTPNIGSDAPPTLEQLLRFPYTATGIAWPRESTVVATDLDTFAAGNLDATIVSGDNADLPDSGDSGAAAIAGEHRLIVSDDALSALLREAVTAPTEAEWSSAMARFTAVLAARAADPAAAAVPRLATVDRASVLTSPRLAETLAALAATPWVGSVDLPALRSLPPVESAIVDHPVADALLADFASLLASETAVHPFSSVLASPELLTGERRNALIALSAQSWTMAPALWAAAVEGYRVRSSEILTAVRLNESSDLLLPSQNGDLPITVTNDLPYPVTVYIAVTPQTPILNVLDPRVELVIEANSQKRASVPVQSIANGDVTIAIGLTSATGVAISQPVFTTITVQAGWETAATAVLASIIVIVFGVGILRTIRRRIRARDERAAAEADDFTERETAPNE